MAARTCPYHGGHIHLCQAFGPDELANKYYLRKKLATEGWRKESFIQSEYCRLEHFFYELDIPLRDYFAFLYNECYLDNNGIREGCLRQHHSRPQYGGLA